MKNPTNKNSMEYLTGQLTAGRFALMVTIVFTAVNLVMLLVNPNWYFLFSASIPYYLTLFCKAVDNNFGVWAVNGKMTILAFAAALVILAVYILCCVMSRKREGWLKGALVLVILDCSALVLITYVLYGSPLYNAPDIILHIWVTWQLWQAVRSLKKLKDR